MFRGVGILGRAGAGKDTLADQLVAQDGYQKVAFGDPLKAEVCAAFDFPAEMTAVRELRDVPLKVFRLAYCKAPGFVEIALPRVRAGHIGPGGSLAKRFPNLQNLTLREIMQTWGTEYRRNSRHGNPDYWVNKVREQIQASPAHRYLVSDVRFPNEADLVTSLGGVLIRVVRPAQERRIQEAEAQGKAAATVVHASETSMAQWPVDVQVINEEGQAATVLRTQALKGMQRLQAAAA